MTDPVLYDQTRAAQRERIIELVYKLKMLTTEEMAELKSELDPDILAQLRAQ